MAARLAPAAGLAAEIANTALCYYGVTPAFGLPPGDDGFIHYARDAIALRLNTIRAALKEN